MIRKSLLFAFACVPAMAFGQSHNGNPDATPWIAAQPSSAQDLNELNEPPKLGIHWARGEEPSFRAREAATQSRHSTSPNMINHGGKIMSSVEMGAIFWGTSWANYSGDKITGMDSWYQGFNDSNYAKTSDEYSGSNGPVMPATSYIGSVIDATPSTGGGSTATILAEVCKVIKSPNQSGNGYYAVYTDTPRGNAQYCAWHSAGTCSGVPVQFAYFFKLDGDSGCDPQDTSGLHSQGLAAIANVSGHELSEARTDPASPGAWYDAQGNENGDKCAWTFNVPLVAFSNNTQWKIQGEWSNAAYTAGSGYANSSGQRGCIAGK